MMARTATGNTVETIDRVASDGDRRYQLLEAAMKKHQFQGNALIEVLHRAQELFGYLDADLLRFVARGLRLPPSRVYGVATFYNYFTLRPPAAHTCIVCLGTACYVKGGDAILVALERRLGVRTGGVTADGGVALLKARCIGACGGAPVVVYDRESKGRQTRDLALSRVEGWLDGH
jgi:bidirectional [NiFe] hydrogenase diaphorase subunit